MTRLLKNLTTARTPTELGQRRKLMRSIMERRKSLERILRSPNKVRKGTQGKMKRENRIPAVKKLKRQKRMKRLSKYRKPKHSKATRRMERAKQTLEKKSRKLRTPFPKRASR